MPLAIELAAVEATEVTDTGQGQGQQPVSELPHAVPAEGDVATDGHALAQLELGNGLAGPGDGGFLAGDHGQVADGTVDDLGVASGLADAHVDHDLGQTGDLHDVGVLELLLQGGDDLFAVLLLQARDLDVVAHQISFPVFWAMRTLRWAWYSDPSERLLVTSTRW